MFIDPFLLLLCKCQLEANFSTLNPNVHVSPTQLAWKPFPLPDSKVEKKQVDFVDGLKTIAGCGEPGLGEGLAIHVCKCPPRSQTDNVFSDYN